MVGLLDLRARGQSDVTSAERKGGGVWWFTKKRKVIVGDTWFRISLLSLSLSELEFWSAGVVCFLLICSAVEKFVFYNVFVFRWIKMGFLCFLPRLTEKLILIIFIFLQISSTFRYAPILCTEAPFSILKKVSAPITSGECSRGR